MKKLLVVGALPDYKHKMRFGGATILMQNFVDYLKAENINFKFAQTNKYSNLKTGKKKVLTNRFYLLYAFIKYLFTCDTIMFNFSDHGTVTVFPYLMNLSKFFGKKIILRKFGGSFDIYLNTLTQKRKDKTLKAISKSDLIFFETLKSIEHLKSLIDNKQIYWFPNNRQSSKIVNEETSSLGNHIGFISNICDEKGISDLLHIAKSLKGKYIFDLYGYIDEKKYENFNWKEYNIDFHGEVESTKIPDILKNLLFLILPTYYREGYPGIIIEALSVGVPVITTNVGGIPEMINHHREGYLFSPGDSEGMIKALNNIEETEYKKMSVSALETFNEKFESNRINNRILSLIQQL